MYYFAEPPFFLVFFGLFIGLTCGLAFEASLKQKANEWLNQTTSQREIRLEGSALQLPFLGICLGICLFLGSGLAIFLFNYWLAYAIALPTTIFIVSLIWIQLGKVLQQLKEGGSKEIDLDAF